MPHLIEVTALQPFTRDGVAVALGDTVLVLPYEAAILRRMGKAALHSDELLRARAMRVLADHEAPTAPRRKRAYRRRDLSAE